MGLRAAAQSTRLRLLAVCAKGEATVSELTRVLEQSQPRVSHHLKLLYEAQLLDRVKEGTWVFYRIADGGDGTGGALARSIAAMIPADDPQVARDRAVLETIMRERAARAAAYFRDNAVHWDRIRSLHVDDSEVESCLAAALPPGSVGRLLDVGTGTGRILALFAGSIERGLGIDLSREMLALARSRLEQDGIGHCRVRRGDMYALPVDDASQDAVTMHQVLHYADRPADAVAEAARALRPGGRMVIVDFAPHDLEELRAEHAHRRLGFADTEVEGWCRAARLAPAPTRHLPGDPLTVVRWIADKPVRPAADDRPRHESRVAEEVRAP